MESEKKITAPKRKRVVSKPEENPASEENLLELPPVERKFELEDFKIGLISEVKPARKRKTTETVKNPELSETAETVSAAEVKPKTRKTILKNKTAADSESIVKKSAPRTAKKKPAEAVEESQEKPKKVRAARKPKALPQTKSSLESPKITRLETAPVIEPEAEEIPFEQRSPIFKELAMPKLPHLQPENRAWLQMQSPTRIFFYWSLKTNPFETLLKIFGGRSADYTLIVKLQNQTDGTEKVYPIESSGSAWFDVESDSRYRAEVGFSAAHRPFVRLMFSNTLETPRVTPSPFFDRTPQFAVSSQEFAEVLDASGYKQDAFEIALAGDDVESSNTATFDAFEHLTGEDASEIRASELRLVLFALASGVSLYDLRDQISPKLFALLERLILENAANLSAEKIAATLEENFGFGSFETEGEETEITYSVFGASRINFQKFPKQFWKRFAPVSSLKVDR